MLSKYRIKFTKGEKVKFISHLDFMRTFNRAVNRARIPIAYSQGFNPHPVLSFAMPLSVGVTSDSEYLDMELQDSMTGDEIIERLNSSLPEGIRVLKAVEVEKKDTLNNITMADYNVQVELSSAFNSNFDESLASFLQLDEIVMEKESKKKTRQVNIKPDIYHLSVNQQTNEVIELKMRLAAGSVSNLKPDLVIEALKQHIQGFEPDYVRIHREQLLIEDGKTIL